MATETRFSTIPNRLTSTQGVLLILAQGLIIRLLFFEGVAVNGDTGLYLYDATRILRGDIMFLEFPSRSPVVEYLLTIPIVMADTFGFSRVVAARGLMIVVALGVAASIYVFATEITDDERVGIASMAFWLLTPFTVSWGMWVKTEQFAALFSLIGLWLTVRELKRDESPRFRMAAYIGVVFAAALLSRRVALVTIGVLGLWVLAHRHRSIIGDLLETRRAYRASDFLEDAYERQSWYRAFIDRHWRDVGRTIGLGVVMVAAMAAALYTAFLLIARGDFALAARMGDSYFLDLIRSDGFGSHGYLPLRDVAGGYLNHEYAHLEGAWWQQFCQKCGDRTLIVFQHTTMVVLPLFLVMLVWVRAFTDIGKHWMLRAAYPIVITTLAIFAIFRVYNPADPLNVLPFVAIGVMVPLVWMVDIPDLEEMNSSHVVLIFTILMMLSLSYLYRDRILYPTYFQDFYPFVAVLCGIAAVGVWDEAGRTLGPPENARHWFMKGAAIVFVISIYTSATWAYPYVGDFPGEDQTDWFTVNRVEAFGTDVDRRLEPGETVFTGNPLFVIESDHRQTGDLSRKYYLFEGWPTTPVTHREATGLKAAFRSGSAPMAVSNEETRTVLAANTSLNRTFQSSYCPVEDPLYEVLENTTLYIHRDYAGERDFPGCGETVDRSEEVRRRL